ncbi:uncharacterized protein LOC110976355 [Acanthaster planci]|uniref:Uncharacterized protein LOC110976355 n=1 Tax=Acanthaster planci TaxID=133434 RepID=A0A8B7XYX9_ACAPL|nr:uncharacterized protein LOC110976355 [Acanthaster planci]
MAIVVKAGPVSGILITVHADFFHANTETAFHIRASIPFSQKVVIAKPFTGAPTFPNIVTLMATATIYPPVSLAYQRQAVLTHVWCSGVASHEVMFSVESTVMATDGQSAFTQHVCDSTDCEVDRNNIAHNGNQLPSNTVVTEPARYMRLTFLVTSWGGAYDADQNSYIGQFLFQAQVRLFEKSSQN